ncbi:MAG: hypothetical protein HOL37_02120 [Rhodospirillaceae bacterium]|jgi:hypothetical protein|nr:hypothetical protein [Rhodospirillaceae bacterium]MBT4219201.1 hypothetical protein [Rhodospirillaceae bacterium]MBT5308108.1 hypothetical protein [Rhodospirillaceae bacterium]MBT7356013.1 hypothetical protein [Rhodospirillaceae bacterium]
MTDGQQQQQKKILAYRVLTLIGLALIVMAYFSPIWWVSLSAPQYPESAFPQGIRIHFHMDGVFNGCKKVESDEKYEEEALNCKHEMDAINHYVGMYPIAAGGPVERTVSPFLVSLVAAMLIAFSITQPKVRLGFFAASCAAIAIWMSMALYSEGGVMLMSPNYVFDFSSTMDLDPEDYAQWSALYTLEESYTEALGRYFRDTVAIAKRVDLMMMVAHGVYWTILAGMAVLVVGLWKMRQFYWLLIIVPAMLPVFFVIEYAAWLWWFGHSLHEMAAFSVKPFMPTVFGQGKVAQFSTYSYPHYGYGLMFVGGLVLALAALVRRKQMADDEK